MDALEAKQPELIAKIVQELKTNGIFDDLRRQCLADVDTKPAFQNLKQRVESHVSGILVHERWTPLLNKNQLRNNIRTSVLQSGILSSGIDRIIHQVIDDKVLTLFLPKISEFISEHGQRIKDEFIAANTIPIPPPEQPVPQIKEEPDPLVDPGQGLEPETKPDLTELNDDINKVPMEIDNDSPPSTAEPIITESETMVVEESDNSFQRASPGKEEIATPVESLQDDATPVIPDEAVNPLRNLIQTLLTSKSVIETTVEENVTPNQEIIAGTSPTIDKSQIESFTDDEGEGTEEYEPTLNCTAEEEAYYGYVAATECATQNEDVPYSPTAECDDATTPPSQSHNEEIGESLDNFEEESNASPVSSGHDSPSKQLDTVEQQPVQAGNNAEDVALPVSPFTKKSPEPADILKDKKLVLKRKSPIIETKKGKPKNFRKSSRSSNSSDSRCSTSGSSSSTTTSSSGSDSSEESDSREQKSKTPENKSPVEELIEETVIEEYSPALESTTQSPKTKGRKKELNKQASHSDSLSSGEISSGGNTSDESAGSDKMIDKPKRRQSPRMLREMEERRIALQRMEGHGRPGYWNTDSSSDCLSPPIQGRPRMSFYERRSPPPFDRFGERPPPPHYRDDRFAPRPPHRLHAPFDRRPADYHGPKMEFGSPPHSPPPMKRFSPPRRLGERYSGDMHRPMHRFAPPTRHRLSPPPPHPTQMHPPHRMR